jgi:hypothetical protein
MILGFLGGYRFTGGERWFAAPRRVPGSMP